MIRGLAGLDRNNEYFIFLKAQDSRHFENLPPNMRRVELPDYSRPMRLAWQHLRAGEQAQRLRLDIWHGTHYTLPHRVSGVRFVATFHDLGVFLHPQFYPAGKRYYFQQTFFHAARIAHGILAVSEVTARDFHRLVSFGKLPQQQGEVQAIASGVNEEFFATVSLAEKKDVRRKYAKDSRYILFVGTAEKRKNLGMLIHAFHRLCQRSQNDYVLLLAGQSGNGSAEVAHAITACSLQNRVKCLGYVAEADLPALYQAADLVVLPSLYEGFGFPALEAMAGGAVTLAANNSAMREMVGHAAMLCENEPEAWAGKMEELLGNQPLRSELISYGRRRAQQFSWHSTAQKLLALYERLHAAKTISVFDLSANGAAKSSRNGATSSKAIPSSPTDVAEAVLRTIAYADLFDYPLRFTEIHDGLLEARVSGVAVSAALQRLQQRGIVAESEGYFFLSDRRRLPEIRRQRSSISRRIIEQNRRIIAAIKNFPFVRGLALSGALAFENGKEGDDLDFCLIVDNRRLWTTYLGLVLLT
ncbi:glycosyltransferase family 1 protein, partial [candidate division KSB1 bacterium]|nr:glycosyltransferase family 1 protein [candidate division KSB1 bacterium]